jgi:hypothetical protein
MNKMIRNIKKLIAYSNKRKISNKDHKFIKIKNFY